MSGVRGTSYAGDIAIDDVMVKNGGCSPSVSCDFEVNYPQYCGWKNINGDNLDWSYGSGTTTSSSTGPSNDHTFGDKRGEITLSGPSPQNARDNLTLKAQRRVFVSSGRSPFHVRYFDTGVFFLFVHYYLCFT